MRCIIQCHLIPGACSCCVILFLVHVSFISSVILFFFFHPANMTCDSLAPSGPCNCWCLFAVGAAYVALKRSILAFFSSGVCGPRRRASSSHILPPYAYAPRARNRARNRYIPADLQQPQTAGGGLLRLRAYCINCKARAMDP